MAFGSLVVVKKDGSDGSKFPLFEGDACKIGPGLGCQVRFGSSTEDTTYCSISLEKKGTIKVQKLSSYPVLVNDLEIASFKLIESGDIIKIAPKTFRFELIKKENADNTVIGMISASKKVNKVSQQPSAVPRISARRSLSDFRVAQIKPKRRSMSATLSTWDETESDVNILKRSNRVLSTQSSKNIIISNSPMQPSSPSVTMNIGQKLTNQAKSRRRLSKSAETRMRTSPKQMLSDISDSSEKSSGTKRKYFDSSSDSQKSTKIPRRFFPPLVTPMKTTRSNKTPVKSETKVTKTPHNTRKVQANEVQKQATPVIKQGAMQFKTPVSAVKKTPVSAVKRTPVSAVKKTPVSAVKKTLVPSVKKTPVPSVKKTPQIIRNKLVSPKRYFRSETKITRTRVSVGKQKASTTTKIYVGSQKSQLKSPKVLTFSHNDEQTHVTSSTKKYMTSKIKVSTPVKASPAEKRKTPKSQTVTPVLKIRSSKRKSHTNTPKSWSANKNTPPTLKVRTLRTTPIILKKTPPSAKAKKGSASKTAKSATSRIPMISMATAKIDPVQKTLVSNQKPSTPIIAKTTPSPSKLLNANHMRILFNKTPKSTGKLMSVKKIITPSSVPTKLSKFVSSATKSAKKIKMESFSSPEKLNVSPLTVKSEQKTPQEESVKKTPRMGSARKTPRVGSARKTPQVGSPKKTPLMGSVRRTPRVLSSKKTPLMGSARKTPQVGSSKKTPRMGSARKTPQVGSEKKTPRADSAKKTPQVKSEKKTPQMKSAKKTPQVKSATVSAGKITRPSPSKAQKVVVSSVKKTPIILTSSRPNNRSFSARLTKKFSEFGSLVLVTPNSEKSIVKKVAKRGKKSPIFSKLVMKTPQSAKMTRSLRSRKSSVEKFQNSQSTSESDVSKYSSTTPKTHAIDEISNSSTERSVRTPESVFNKPPVTPNIKAIKSAKKKSDSITKSIVKRSTVKKRKISDLADTPSKLLKMKLPDDVYDGCTVKEEVNTSKTSQTDSPKPKLNSSKRTSIINAENKTMSPEKTVQIVETRSSTRKSASKSLSKSMFDDQNVSTASSKTSTPKKRLSRKSYTLLSPNNTQGNMDLFNVSDVSLVHNESVASNNVSNLTGLSGIHSLPNTSFGSNLIDFGSPRRTPRSKMNNIKMPVAKIMATTTNSPLTSVQQKKLRSSLLLQNISIAEEQVIKSEPSAVEGLNKLFRSPKISSLPLNDLSSIINVENQNESLQKISTPTKDVQIKSPSPSPRKSARKTPANKSQSSILSPENLRVSSLKKLARTPVQKSPKNDLTNVGGLKKLYKTPVVQKSPLNDLTDVKGVKNLMKTPGNKVASPKNDLTNVAGVKRLLKTPVAQKSPLNDLSNIKGVKSLMKTPGKKIKSPKNDLTDVAGLKNLYESPTVQKSPHNDLSDVRGVRDLLKTPGRKAKSPKNDLTQVGGLKKLYGTPIVQKSPLNDLSDVKGVKSLLKTPGRKARTPKNDLTNVIGVKTLYKLHKSPRNDLTDVRGVKNLLETPGRKAKSPKNDLTQVAGVKRLLSSPKLVKSPKNDLSNIENLAYIFEENPSSAQRISGILKSSIDAKNTSRNVELDKTFDLLYNEEKSSENEHLIVSSANKTYERKTRSSTPQNPEKNNVPLKMRDSVPYTKKSMVILKWIEEQNKGIDQNEKKESTSINNKELPPRKRFKHVSDFIEQNDDQKEIEKTHKEGSTDVESLAVVERITTKAIIEQSEPALRSSRRKLVDNSEPVAKSPVKRGKSDIETVSSVPKKRTRRQKVDDEIVVVKESPVTRSNRNKQNYVHSIEVCQEIINKTTRHNVGKSEMVVESVEVKNISPSKSNILNVVGLVKHSKAKGKRVKKNTVESVEEEIPVKKVKFEITSPVEESSPDKEKVTRTRNTRAKTLGETKPAKSTKSKVAVQEVNTEEELPKTTRRRKIIETETKEVEVKSGATKTRGANKVAEEKPASPVKTRTRSRKAKDTKEENETEKREEKETVKKEIVKKEEKKVTSKSKKPKTTDENTNEQNMENVPMRSTRRKAVVNEEVPQVKAKSTRSKVTEDAPPIRKSARTRVQKNT